MKKSIAQLVGVQSESSYLNTERLDKPHLRAALKSTPEAAGAVAIAIATALLAGWAFDIPILKSIWPSLVAGNGNTAICFILGGGFLWYLGKILKVPERRNSEENSSFLVPLSGFFIISAMAIGLVQYGWKVNFDTENLLVKQAADAFGASIAGWMLVNSALNFILLVGAVVLLKKKASLLAQWFSLIAFFASFLAPLGYACGISTFYNVWYNTAANSETLRAGGDEMGLSLLAASYAIVLSAVIWWNSRKQEAMDVRCPRTKRECYLAALANKRAEELNVALQDLKRSQAEQKRVEEALRKAEAKYRSIFENAVEGIFQTTADGHFLTVNPMLARIYGYDSPEELIATVRNIERQLYADPFRRTEFRRIMQEQGVVWNFESQVYRKDGSAIWISENSRAIRDESGRIVGYEGTVEDITRRKQAAEDLEKSLSLLRATLESTADGILAIDLQGKLTIFNQSLLEMLRMPESILASDDMQQRLAFIAEQLKYPEEFSRKLAQLLAQPDAESWDIIEFKDGRILERYSRPQQLGGTIIGRVFSFRDITHRTQAEEKIRYQAFHDLLTELPNRILFNEQLSVSLNGAVSNENKLAVMFLDLDRFKTINDTLGHDAGDRLLQEVAKRIKSCLRSGDTVARWGGDEFTLVLPHIHSRKDAAAIAERIQAALKPEFALADRNLHVNSSIGIALYPDDGEDADTLIKNADAALYRAKEQGRNTWEFYTPAINSKASELLTLENSLYGALERGEFEIYYQPKVNIDSWKITGMEALLRWRHPALGLVSPAIFIPLAEENRLIVPIGEWLLKTACLQNKAWLEAGFFELRVAVNLSVRQFQQSNFVEMVARILAETGLEPRFLELEITESTAMQDIELCGKILTELNAMGIRLSMDDFGTGYSSLSYLKMFPFDSIKIDKSFAGDLTGDRCDAAIAKAAIAIGRGLNLQVVAEGVETPEQLACLKALQCEEMQGFFFSPPLSVQDATALLQGAVSVRENTA